MATKAKARFNEGIGTGHGELGSGEAGVLPNKEN